MGDIKKEMATHEGVTKSNHRNHSNRKDSQCQQILKHLMDGKTITSFEAFTRFGCTKLTTRVSELRRKGVPIIGEWESKGDSRYMRYRIGETE